MAQNERGDATGTGALAGSSTHVNEPSVFIKRGELLTIQILAFDSQDVLCPKCLEGTPSLGYNTELLRLWGAKEADLLRRQARRGRGKSEVLALPQAVMTTISRSPVRIFKVYKFVPPFLAH